MVDERGHDTSLDGKIKSFDESIDRFRISVDVRSARFGPLFGYRGTFQCDWLELSDAELPARLLPRRQEHRD